MDDNLARASDAADAMARLFSSEHTTNYPTDVRNLAIVACTNAMVSIARSLDLMCDPETRPQPMGQARW
jgi:hypothetical protein